MKKKLLLSTLIVILILATGVINASSMMFGIVDGRWGLVDVPPVDPEGKYKDGAMCLRYGNGPDSTYLNPDYDDAPVTISWEDPSVQDGTANNWNQIRYGAYRDTGWPFYNPICGSQTSKTDFVNSSGLAFLGAVGPDTDFAPLEPFVLGRLCHVNKPINAGEGADLNLLDYTWNDIVVEGVNCGPDAVMLDEDGNELPPDATINLNYTFVVKLDETKNDMQNCPYTKFPGDNDCPDAIIPGQLTGAADQVLRCRYPNNDLELNIALLGFSTVDKNSPCPSEPPATMPGIFVSQERATNCVCLWGMITDVVPAAVEMNFFNANGGNESVVLEWQTAFETENLGFNIYRSTNGSFEDAEKLNPTLIESLVPTGSTYGADYQFVDATANPFVTYYYWLEDVDVNGETELHGPVSAEWID